MSCVGLRRHAAARDRVGRDRRRHAEGAGDLPDGHHGQLPRRPGRARSELRARFERARREVAPSDDGSAGRRVRRATGSAGLTMVAPGCPSPATSGVESRKVAGDACRPAGDLRGFEEAPLVRAAHAHGRRPRRAERVPLPPPQEPAGPVPSLAAPRHPDDPLKARKKRDKMRAAWIAFAGRILAQLIGAIATVVLGVYVVRTYGVDRTPRASARPEAAPVARGAARPARAPVAGGPAVHVALVIGPPRVPQRWPHRGADRRPLAHRRPARHLADVVDVYKDTTKTLPTIAGNSTSSLVVEGAVAREGDHVRVTVQLIDARPTRTCGRRPTIERRATSCAAGRGHARDRPQELHAAMHPRQEQAAAAQAGIDAAGLRPLPAGAPGRSTRRSPPTWLTRRRSSRGDCPGAGVRAGTRRAGQHVVPAGTRRLRRAGRPRGARPRRDVGPRGPAPGSRTTPTRTWRSRWSGIAATGTGPRRSASSRASSSCTRATRRRTSGTRSSWPSRAGTSRRSSRRRALALDPDAAPVHRTAGLVALYARRLGDAETVLRRSLDARSRRG